MTKISKGRETAGRFQDKFKKRNNKPPVTDDVGTVKDSLVIIRVKIAPTETKCEQKLPQLEVGRDFRGRELLRVADEVEKLSGREVLVIELIIPQGVLTNGGTEIRQRCVGVIRLQLSNVFVTPA